MNNILVLPAGTLVQSCGTVEAAIEVVPAGQGRHVDIEVAAGVLE